MGCGASTQAPSGEGRSGGRGGAKYRLTEWDDKADADAHPSVRAQGANADNVGKVTIEGLGDAVMEVQVLPAAAALPEPTPEEKAVARRLADRGVTLKQLLHFYDAHAATGQLSKDTSTEDVVRQIVLGETVAQRCCYMESEFMRGLGGPRTATKLVSHAWRSKFSTTVLNVLLDACGSFMVLKEKCYDSYGPNTDPTSFSCSKALKELTDATLSSTYWICVFAVNQHASICGDCGGCREAAAAPWGPDMYSADGCATCQRPKRYPCPCGMPKLQASDVECELNKFSQVAQLMEQGLVVCLDHELLALSRMWVLREVGAALTGKPVCFRQAEGLSITRREEFRRGLPVVKPLKDCDVASAKDREMILAEIQRERVGCSAFDEFVNAIVELSFGRCASLADISVGTAKALTNVRQLEMKFQWSVTVLSDLSMLGFGKGLLGQLPCLTSLAMDFSWCKLIEDVDLLFVEFRVLKKLQVLKMDFANCAALANVEGLKGMGGLKELQELKADFSSCHRLEDIGGLEGLGGLKELHELDLNFRGCKELRDMRPLGDHLRGLQELQAVRMCCNGCGNLEDVGSLEGLGSLASLQELRLSFIGCSKLKDISKLLKDGCGFSLLKKLRTLWLDFADCKVLADVGQLAGVGGMPQLQTLFLNFSNCFHVPDIDGLRSMASLKELRRCTLNVTALPVADVAPLAEGLRGLAALEDLDVSLERCEKLADLAPLGEALPSLQGLGELKLNFAYCWRLANVAPVSEGAGQLMRLHSLTVNFDECKLLTDTCGVGALSSLRALKKLDLRLSGTGITDLSALGSVLGSLQALEECKLDLSCTNITNVEALGPGLGALTDLRKLAMSFVFCKFLQHVRGLEQLANMKKLASLALNFEYCDQLPDANEVEEALGQLENLTMADINLSDSGVPHDVSRRISSGWCNSEN